MTPDIEDLRFVCRFQLDELFAELHHLLRLLLVVHGRLEAKEILLHVEAEITLCRTRIPDAGILTDEIHDMIVVGWAATRIREADDVIADQLLQILSILLDLTDDLLIPQLRKMRVGQCMGRDLMSLIQLHDLPRLNLVVPDPHILTAEITRLSEQLGVQIKGTLHVVFIKQLHETLILRHTIIITECEILVLHHSSAFLHSHRCEVRVVFPRTRCNDTIVQHTMDLLIQLPFKHLPRNSR